MDKAIHAFNAVVLDPCLRSFPRLTGKRPNST
jgi:hypothetical protein